mgnify:CR=1 FL=1
MPKHVERALLQFAAAIIVLIVTVGLVAPSLVSAKSDLLVVFGFVVAAGGIYGAGLMIWNAIQSCQKEENQE